ncbi:testis-expressed protein 10 homolog [Labrus bergylta]|uniref:Testis expressed 10 n=1 Tax=Labrus bergylta TaxID=56723 RepID=A0A3Q3E887_9LABR|nr:testis-expressed protein 10 [Labrus bergylta]
MKSKKKKRQDDFQKVKLKVGKTKPKAVNATNTSFRTKGIHLSEQLKKDTSGPTTHRQLGINDLLSQLHHHNANIKHGALVGLKELLSLNPSLLEQHLSRLLSEVAAVFTDKDGNVRVAATRVLRFIAQSVPAERVAPFFPLLSAHLSCAMTHIEPSIQEDAMKVLDVLLEHYPALLAARPAVLLTNFLELISHKQSSNGTKKTPDAKGRTWSLSVNPSRAVTSQQWRLSVLSRLGRFLQAVVEERPVEESDIFVQTEGVSGSRGEDKLTPLYLNWEELSYNNKVGVRVYEHSGAKPTQRSTFKLRPEVDPGPAAGEGLDSADSVQSFAATLVPLLLEVWVEASTSDCPSNSSEGAHLLTPEAMSVMFQVLSILQLLRKLAPQQEHQDTLDAWFHKEYLGDFKQHFMKNFPYGTRDTPKHRKKVDLKRSKQTAAVPGLTVEPLALNITLCQVMVSLSQRQGVGRETDGDWLTPLRMFVRDTLSSGVKLSYRQLHMLLGTVWKMVLTQRSKTVTEELLAAVYVYYKQRNLTLQTRSLLLSFYSKLYLQEQGHTHIARSKVLCCWLASLPVQLSQLGHRNPALSARLILSIQAAASRGNKDLLNSLQTNACRLYDPQEGVVVLLPAESQQQMVQLLYFLPKMSQSLLANLSCCCTAGRISASLAATLIRIVHFRSSLSCWLVGSQEAALQDVDYISFLFSTLTGFSSDRLASLQDDEDDYLPPSPLSPLSLYPTPLEQFTHHWDVVEEVCHSLETLGSKSQCFDILQNGICKYLTKLGVVPDSMAAGLLRAVSRLMDLSVLPIEPVLRFLSQCCLSLLALLINLQQELPAETNHKREAIWGACVSALSTVPRLLRMVLQLLRVGDLSEDELPQLGQILAMLLQHTPIINQLLANASLLQEIIQRLTRYSRASTREQWLTDLLYSYSVTVTHGSSARRGNLGLRDMY